MSNRIDKYREDFLDYLERERNYSPHTINSYRTDLLQFCQFIQHLQVDSKILIKTSKTLSEGSLSDMKIIKLFVYKVLAYTKEEIIKSELQIDFSKNDSWRIFKDDDWMVKQDKVICLLLYSTIISPAQIIDLDLNHLQLNQNKINISGKQKKRQTITFCKKTQKAINGLIQHRKNHFKKIILMNLYSFQEKEVEFRKRHSILGLKNFLFIRLKIVDSPLNFCENYLQHTYSKMVFTTLK